MRIWKIPDQVIRIAILFIVAIVALVVVRQKMIPESFGELGHYRSEAVTIAAELPIHFAGLQACVECHDDIDRPWPLDGNHRGFSIQSIGDTIQWIKVESPSVGYPDPLLRGHTENY